MLIKIKNPNIFGTGGQRVKCCVWYRLLEFYWDIGLHWFRDFIDYASPGIHICAAAASRFVLLEAVDWCICFILKIQHGGDWERSRPQGPKNVYNCLMTVRPLSWAFGHETELLLILKKTIFDLIFARYIHIWQSKEMSHDFVRGQSVAETCFSHWGYRSRMQWFVNEIFREPLVRIAQFCV